MPSEPTSPIQASAKLTSRGRVTIPAPVRARLGLRPGDRLRFRVEGARATIEPARDFLVMAGSVPIPERTRGMPWDEVRRLTRHARARRLV